MILSTRTTTLGKTQGSHCARTRHCTVHSSPLKRVHRVWYRQDVQTEFEGLQLYTSNRSNTGYLGVSRLGNVEKKAYKATLPLHYWNTDGVSTLGLHPRTSHGPSSLAPCFSL